MTADITNTETMAASDVTEQLRKAAEEEHHQDAKIISKPAPNSPKPIASNITVNTGKNTSNKKSSVNTTSKVPNMVKAASDPTAKTIETIQAYLDSYKNLAPNAPERIQSFARVVETAMRNPKKSVLESILKFFVDNKQADFLSPMNALQGITMLSKSANIKVRTMYEIMRSLANNEATKKTMALNMVNNIFKSDELVNWIYIKIDHRK